MLAWGAWAVAVEHAALPELAILAVASAAAFLFSPVRRQVLQLLRRSRWLLAVLLLTYAFTVPGVALWPALGDLSPSVDGLRQGALRVTRLLLLLAGVALLLATTARPRLIYGFYVLARPLAWLGFDRRAFAVRLGLTLDYIEHSPPATRWLDALRAPPPDAALPATCSLWREPWQSADSALILAAGLLLGWIAL
jgi:hypothetical protein